MIYVANPCCSAGAVIMETPVLPVMEGEAATLCCRIKSSPANSPAVFCKDGMFIGTSSTGNMSIPRVYKSHEGLYMCRISGAGESPQSWLVVRGEIQICFRIKANLKAY